MEEYKDSTCSCKNCQDMCRRPCWPTPEEARMLIEKGYSERLMADWWVEYPRDIFILGPAYPGYEAELAPEELRFESGCTFFKDGLCELHEPGLKPFEGRMATCKETQSKLHEDVAMLWNNPEAQEFCETWKARERK